MYRFFFIETLDGTCAAGVQLKESTQRLASRAAQKVINNKEAVY